MMQAILYPNWPEGTDVAAAVAPGTQVTSDANGKAVAAAVQVPPSELILGEYSPLPVDGTSSNSTSGARGRILLYDNKAMIKE